MVYDERFWQDDVLIDEGDDEQRLLFLSWIRMCVERAHDAALRGIPGEAEFLLARAQSLAEMVPRCPSGRGGGVRDAGDEIFDMGAVLVRRALSSLSS